MAEARLEMNKVGTIAAGDELPGSETDARIGPPFSRAHRFEFIFHQFRDDQGGDNLGQEYDLVTSYKLNEYISFLWKAAYFDGGNNRSPATRTRSILQTTFEF